MEKRNTSLEIFKKITILILITITSIMAGRDEAYPLDCKGKKCKIALETIQEEDLEVGLTNEAWLIVPAHKKKYCPNFILESIPEECLTIASEDEVWLVIPAQPNNFNFKEYYKNFPLSPILEESDSDSDSLAISSGDDEPKISSSNQPATTQLQLMSLLGIGSKKSKLRLKKLRIEPIPYIAQSSGRGKTKTY